MSRQLYQVCNWKREVYGSGKRRGSAMQTTTAISTDVPAQTQHFTKGRSLWIEKATRLHNTDNHYCVHGHTSKNAEVYGFGKQLGFTMQMITALCAGIQPGCNESPRTDISGSRSTAASQCRRPLPFLRGMPARIWRVEVDAPGLMGVSGEQMWYFCHQQSCRESVPIPRRAWWPCWSLCHACYHVWHKGDPVVSSSLVGRQLPFLAEHDDLAYHFVVLAAWFPPDVRFHHEVVKRQHFFLRESMHLLPLVTVHVLDRVR